MNPFLNTVDRPTTQVFESGVNQVAAGGDIGGWVSGTIASLAASATVDVIFDLGALWRCVAQVQVMVAPAGTSTGLSNVQVVSSDTAAFNANRRLKDVAAAGPSTVNIASLTTANGVQAVLVKPAGRYLVVRATNADATNAQGAGAQIAAALYGA